MEAGWSPLKPGSVVACKFRRSVATLTPGHSVSSSGNSSFPKLNQAPGQVDLDKVAMVERVHP